MLREVVLVIDCERFSVVFPRDTKQLVGVIGVVVVVVVVRFGFGRCHHCCRPLLWLLLDLTNPLDVCKHKHQLIMGGNIEMKGREKVAETVREGTDR